MCSPCDPPLLLKLQEIQSLKLELKKAGCFPQHDTGPDVQESAKGWGPQFWTSGLGSGKNCRIPPGQNKYPRQRLGLKGRKKIQAKYSRHEHLNEKGRGLRRPKLENTDNSVFPSGNFHKSRTTFSPRLQYNILTTYILLCLTCISGDRTVQRVRRYSCLSNT